MWQSITAMILPALVMTSLTLVQSKALIDPDSLQTQQSNLKIVDNNSRQLPYLAGIGRETSTPDFIRLVVMRFIYGLASTMGVEDRLEGIFNGAFVPPNADSDFFGFADSDGDGGDYDDGSLDGFFGDDVL